MSLTISSFKAAYSGRDTLVVFGKELTSLAFLLNLSTVISTANGTFGNVSNSNNTPTTLSPTNINGTINSTTTPVSTPTLTGVTVTSLNPQTI